MAIIQPTRGTVTGLPYHKKEASALPEWESEWQRVQRIRREPYSLARGGQWRRPEQLTVTIIANQ